MLVALGQSESNMQTSLGRQPIRIDFSKNLLDHTLVLRQTIGFVRTKLTTSSLSPN